MPEPIQQPIDAELADAGEWLFKQQNALFGPVPASALVAKVEAGELGPDTPVSRSGERFEPIADVPVFRVHVAKAVARRRVETDARAEARSRRNRRIAKALAILTVTGALAGGAVAGVLWVLRSGILEERHDELADLEIQASPPLVQLAVAARPDEEDVDYLAPEAEAGTAGAGAKPASRKAAGKGTTRPASAVASATGARPAAGEADDVGVEAQYDIGAIQAVVRREQSKLFPCLKEEAGRDLEFRGDVPFTFTVGNDGKVSKLWIDRPGKDKGPFRDCMQRELGRWSFPRFEGEQPSVSLSFRVGR